MNIDTKAIGHHLAQFNFSELFTQELGWDWYDADLPVIEADGRRFTLTGVAEKRGMVVVECTPEDAEALPDYAVRKKIEHQVTKRAFEHLLIFTDSQRKQQVWQFARREHGQSVKVRELVWHGGTSGQDLIQRLSSLAIDLDDEDSLTLQDVIRLAQSQMDVEKVTKKFYQLFDKQKNAFTKAIQGIGTKDDQQWYASVMLNRLMFIYFVQKKGFLDGDRDYLRTKLTECQMHLGQNQFHNFYRSFLLVLFHDGLNKRPEEHTPELKALIGNVPYLNGGIFDIHKIEEAYGDDIDISDEAFEKIFEFFDGYRWHLDDRPIVKGNEINPDVLGYIFEKYINQKQMGAYYTKEDITGYISKNTIIPHLFDRVGGIKGTDLSYAYDLLREDPDRYIYDAVKHGWAVDIHQKDANGQSIRLDKPHELPADIAAGLEDLDQWDLIERRKCWNRPAPAEVALPTEIWREVVHRRQRYFDLKAKLEKGEVREISDLITLNLNITVFARDAIDRCPDKKTLAEFWKALTAMTVLDPTCGSGAFLFAALEILEPLYEATLNRMDGLLHDLAASGKKPHPESHEQRFQDTLAEVAKHPNRSYFILKSIIVQNLYGVDIMEEAVEICKLRLFLKLAAQVEPRPREKNYGIEPLPDIDFNIKAGNTLVGFATESEVRRVLTQEGEQMKILTDDELFGYERVEGKLQALDSLYKTFCQSQLENDDKGRAKVKDKISRELREVATILDEALAHGYKINPNNDKKFDAWKKCHQPFHWFCEFFGIIKNGGFDVVIGNPPYFEINTLKGYQITGYQTLSAGNIYAPAMERSDKIARENGRLGFIVPVSSISTERYKPLQDLLVKRELHAASFDDRPSRLFDGLQHIRLTILILGKRLQHTRIATTNYNKWYGNQRNELFSILEFSTKSLMLLDGTIGKFHSEIESSITSKIVPHKPVGTQCARSDGIALNYSRKVGYFLQFLDFDPEVRDRNGELRPPSEFKSVNFDSLRKRDLALIAFNSSLFYWFLTVFSDCRHVNKREVVGFRINLSSESKALTESSDLRKSLMDDLKKKSKIIRATYSHDSLSIQSIYPKHSKPIIDEIDKALAPHYGFTPEELDFIINYDIKYRMGMGNMGDTEEED